MRQVINNDEYRLIQSLDEVDSLNKEYDEDFGYYYLDESNGVLLGAYSALKNAPIFYVAEV